MAAEPHKAGDFAMRCMEIRGGSRAVEESFETPGLDAWVYSRPFEGADSGGDLHYISVCGGGVITRLIIADVSGHGAQVAEFSAVLRALMRKNINTKSQTGLVKALNQQFGEMAQTRHFATAVVATYLATRQSLTVCNAGHPPPLWFRAETGKWALLDETIVDTGNLPLGLDEESPYHQFTVPLGRGDIVVFYTDALTEATDSAGRMIGEVGLLDRVGELDRSDARRIGPALLASVESHRGGRPAGDDVTLLVLSHNATGPRPPTLGEKVGVYAKVFGLRQF